jgi:hypothetical protein
VIVDFETGDVLGTLRCACGHSASDAGLAGWYFSTKPIAGSPYRTVEACACPAHHTLYADPPMFVS